MSPQSVAIETFRHIRDEARNGVAGDVVVHVAPTVAVQMDFWVRKRSATSSPRRSRIRFTCASIQ